MDAASRAYTAARYLNVISKLSTEIRHDNRRWIYIEKQFFIYTLYADRMCDIENEQCDWRVPASCSQDSQCLKKIIKAHK
jgi:hypothetical protein